MVSSEYCQMRRLERLVVEGLSRAGITGDMHTTLPASWFAMQGPQLITLRVSIYQQLIRGTCPWNLSQSDRDAVWHFVGAAIFDHHRRAAAEQFGDAGTVAGEPRIAAKPTLQFRTRRIGKGYHAKRA